jgi:hypothetical protein
MRRAYSEPEVLIPWPFLIEQFDDLGTRINIDSRPALIIEVFGH